MFLTSIGHHLYPLAGTEFRSSGYIITYKFNRTVTFHVQESSCGLSASPKEGEVQCCIRTIEQYKY